jgi:hypothetical protein
MENGDSLVGVGEFLDTNNHFLPDQTWENTDLQELVNDNITLSLQDATPRIGYSRPETTSNCFPWNPISLSYSHFSSEPSIGADSVQPADCSREIYDPHQIGYSDLPATPGTRRHNQFDGETGYQATQYLSPGQPQDYSTTNSMLDTPGSSTAFSDPEALYQVSTTTTPEKKSHLSHPEKKKTLIPKEAVTLFKSVFSNDCYPDKHEYARLAQQTGLSAKQARSWFTNYRHRGEPRSQYRAS